MSLMHLWIAGVDIARLRHHLGDRLTQTEDARTDTELPLSDEARSAMNAALDRARKGSHPVVDHRTMLWALAANDEGGVADILRAAGSTPARLRALLGER